MISELFDIIIEYIENDIDLDYKIYIFEKYLDKVNWTYLSKNKNISEKFFMGFAYSGENI